jgi:phospholipid/cholesterol/gamma-HCH transport system substrate-binding protein
VKIPKGSVARAVSADLLGNKAIDVVFSKNKTYVESGDTLVADTERGLKESFNRQIAPLQAKAENLMLQIDSLMKVFNMMLNTRTRENIDQSFESVRRAILSIERSAYRFDDMIATEKPKISSLLTNLDGISSNLQKNEKKINNILNNFSNLSDSLAKSELKSAISKADNTLRELNEIMTKINSGQGTLGKLVHNDSLYDNLNRSAADLDKMLKDLKHNPKRYVHFSIFGKKNKVKP